MCGRAIVLNHFGLLSVGSLLVGQLDAQWCQVASPPKKAYRGLQKICPRKCTFPSMVGEIQPFTGVWPQTLVWWEIHDLGYQYVVRLPESSTCFFYFYPFLVPVGVPKFAWLWKTNSMITLYCIYSYLIDHIKPYIRTYIYIYTPYISTINILYDHTKNIIQHLPICIIQHPISQFLPFFQKASRPQRSFTPEPQRAAPLPPRRTLPPPPPSLAEPASAPLLGTPRTWLDAPKRCNLTFKTVVEVRFIQIPCVGDSSKRWWRFNDA